MRGDVHPVPTSGVLDVLEILLDDQRIAFALADVVEVLPAAEVTPLPGAPSVVRGLLNLRGEPLPVLDLRARVGLPERPADADDHVLVCLAAGRRLGVWVDRAEGVRALDTARLDDDFDGVQARYVSGAAMVDGGVLLVSDVDAFLSLEESEALDLALVGASKAASDD